MSVLSVWDDAKSRFVPQEVSITPPTSSFASRVAASALAVAKPVYTTSTGKVALCNATELSVRKAFAGLTVTSAAADGDSVDVAYSGQTSTGHSGLSVGKAYWLCGANVVSETDLQAWIDAQASDTPYRQLGSLSPQQTSARTRRRRCCRKRNGLSVKRRNAQRSAGGGREPMILNRRGLKLMALALMTGSASRWFVC